MDLRKKSVIVTGGSRGLGLGLVDALAAQGALVTVVARDAARLSALSDRLGVIAICADVMNPEVPMRVLSEIKPSVLALNAGATPRMAPFGGADLVKRGTGISSLDGAAA